jgi:hypothetical protein
LAVEEGDDLAALRAMQDKMDEALQEAEIVIEDAKLFLTSRGIAT